MQGDKLDFTEYAEYAARHVAELQLVAQSTAPVSGSLPIPQNWLALYSGFQGFRGTGMIADCDNDTENSVTEATQVRGFLDSVYRCAKDGKINDGIDLIIDHIDQWLSDEQTGRCEMALAWIDVDRIPDDLVFSFVTSTLAAKSDLAAQRPMFIIKARNRISALRGLEFARKLLARYE